MRDDGEAYYQQHQGSCPNPDRKSNRRRRQERMRAITSISNNPWWLEPSSGMLRPEIIQEVLKRKGYEE